MNTSFFRHLSLLKALPRFPQKIGTEAMQKQLCAAGHEVDLRTIQRDLNALSAAFSISGDDAKPQGWSWNKDAASLELSPFDPHAALVLQMARFYLERLLPEATLEHLTPQFRQSTETLNRFGNGLRNWPDKIRVLPKGPYLKAPVINAQIQATLYDALLQERQVSVSYRKRTKDEGLDYLINPLGLIVRDQITYLIATFDGYTDPRQLALHRVSRAEIQQTSAISPKGFSLDAYIQQGEMNQPVGPTILLRFMLDNFAAIQLEECPMAADQQIQDSEFEDYKLISATVQDTLELRWWLKSFGDEAVVLEPPELVEHFRKVAENLHANYSS